MNLPPSSHHLRCGTESEQFPLTRRMSGFRERERVVASHTIMAATTSASPPPLGYFV